LGRDEEGTEMSIHKVCTLTDEGKKVLSVLGIDGNNEENIKEKIIRTVINEENILKFMSNLEFTSIDRFNYMKNRIDDAIQKTIEAKDKEIDEKFKGIVEGFVKSESDKKECIKKLTEENIGLQEQLINERQKVFSEVIKKIEETPPSIMPKPRPVSVFSELGVLIIIPPFPTRRPLVSPEMCEPAAIF